MANHRSASNTRDIELSVELSAAPEDVFRALTDGTELMKWIAPEARVTLPSDGDPVQVWISWGEGMAAECPIEIFNPVHRLRLGYGTHPETQATLWTDWFIVANAGSTTTLRLMHSGLSASEASNGEYDSLARGWRLMLANLRHYFARHPKESASHVAFTAQAKLEHERAWRALLSPRGMDFAAQPQAGDSYRVTTSDGALLSGTVELANGRDLALTVNELDDALLRVSLEGGSEPGSSTYVYGYVIAYGSAAPRAAELAASMKKVVSALG